MDRVNGLPLLLPNICQALRGRDLRGRVLVSATPVAAGSRAAMA